MADEYIRKADAIKQCGFGMTSLHIADNLRKMRPADVAPVVHGRWYHSECDKFKCGLCGYAFTVIQGADRMRYCPNCGAKMCGEEWQDD